MTYYAHIREDGTIDGVYDQPFTLELEVEPEQVEITVDEGTGEKTTKVVKEAVFETLEGMVVETEVEVSPLWTYDRLMGRFVAPPKPKPTDTPLNRLQFNAMTRILGVSMGAIMAVIENTIQDPIQQAVAIARIEETQLFRRDNPLFELVGPALQMTNEQIDQAWETALTIE